jgi:hypothetical protein
MHCFELCFQSQFAPLHIGKTSALTMNVAGVVKDWQGGF